MATLQENGPFHQVQKCQSMPHPSQKNVRRTSFNLRHNCSKFSPNPTKNTYIQQIHSRTDLNAQYLIDQLKRDK